VEKGGIVDNELLLLGLLREQRRHGYELHEFLEHSLHYLTAMKRPTAYATLDRLARRGLVTRQSEREGNYPERQVYSITPEGERVFQNLLIENLCSAPRTFYHTDVGLLFMDQVPRSVLITCLETKRQQLLAQRDALRETLPEHFNHPAAHIIERDIALLNAELTWFEGFIAGLLGGA
jgi:DNA-binding PadR family transcriptional regulator